MAAISVHNVLAYAIIILLLIATLFTCIGVGISVYKLSAQGITNEISLWRSVVRMGDATQTTDIGSLSCGKFISALRASAAFSIISIFVLFAAAVTIWIYTWKALRIAFFGGAALLGLSCVTLVISWAILAGGYTSTGCGQASLKDAGYNYGPGFALLVTAWVIDVVCTIIFVVVAVLFRPETTPAPAVTSGTVAPKV